MVNPFQYSAILAFFIVLAMANHSEHLQSSEGETLLRIQRILNYPNVLNGWNNSTDFCNLDPSPSVTVVCYAQSITQLHIIGTNGTQMLPKNFSVDSFVTTLVALPNLKVLTLASLGLWGPLPGKISRLTSLEVLNMSSNFMYDSIPEDLSLLTGLQALILDDNMFSGELPHWIGSLSLLSVLSLRKNMFNGTLPDTLSGLENLRVISLSHNYFHGEVPEFSRLTNLQVFDLEDNSFGPRFPRLGNKVVTLVLSKNKFRDSLPPEMASFYQLQRLDLSHNKFVGPFPASVLALPSIAYLNIEDNKFTGKLFANQSCGSDLKFVDLSWNLISGDLPRCLESKAEYSGNCMATRDQRQNPISFCRNEALAVGILPQGKKGKGDVKVIALGVIGGLVGGIALVGLIFLLVRKVTTRKTIKRPTTRLISENASMGYPSKLLSDARYISQTMKLGGLGIPAYRTFLLEELEEATNRFDTSTFIGEGSQGQMYKGRLKNGSSAAIRCLKMKRSYSTQKFMHHIELISKLRHPHLVSALGHCFECYLDDSSVSRIFLVFEYVPNGTLRSWISEGHKRQKLNWGQRIAAAIGIVKGIQFLHTGIVPGVYSNNLKITDVLMDHNLVAKIRSYNLPLLAEFSGKVGNGAAGNSSKDPSSAERKKLEEKNDVYDFGVILLEIIVGKPVNSGNEVELLKDQIQSSIMSDETARRSVVDRAVEKEYSDQALKTMMEICYKCLVKNAAERPSVEDVLWNLQFAAQVQDGWRSSEGSPISPLNPPHLHLALH